MGVFIAILIMIILGLCGLIWLIKQFQDYSAIKESEVMEITKRAYYHKGRADATDKWGAAVGNQNHLILEAILEKVDFSQAANAIAQNTSPPPPSLPNVPNDAQNAGTQGRNDAGNAPPKVDKREMERKFTLSPTVSKMGKFSNGGDIIILERTADGAKFWTDMPKPYDNEGESNKKLNAFISDDDKTIKLFAGYCQERTCPTIFITQSEDGKYCSDNCRKKAHKQN